jgi:hypothetical protein
MFHHVVRPLLRVALLSVLLGAVPPAPVPVVHATSHTPLAVFGPPLAPASVAAAAMPLAAPISTTVPHPEPPPPSIPAHAGATTTPAFGALPLAFVPNVGQTDQIAKFHARGLGGRVFFTPDAIVLALPVPWMDPANHDPTRDPHEHGRAAAQRARTRPNIVRLRFEGATGSPMIAPAERLPSSVNFIRGNDSRQWQTNLPTYAGINYQ